MTDKRKAALEAWNNPAVFMTYEQALEYRNILLAHFSRPEPEPEKEFRHPYTKHPEFSIEGWGDPVKASDDIGVREFNGIVIKETVG